MMSATTTSGAMQQGLMRAWQRRGLVAWLLSPLALLFFLIISARRVAYRRGVFSVWQPPVPVIVIGNIFVGGTGKTPLVIWLLSQLRARGYVPGVISRGYGRRGDQIIEVLATGSAADAGDEPLLIAQKSAAPVFVGRDRVAVAQALLASHPEVNVIVADDGLQHYALGRTVELQLSDSRGHGNGWLLPAGPLREPASRQSDFYVVNGADHAEPPTYAMQLSGAHAVALSDPRRPIALSSFEGKRVAAVAGIGHPERFFRMLRSQGVTLAATLAVPDHFDYRVNPFADMTADVILITEKDAVKCARIAGIAQDTRLWMVPVEAVIAGPLAERIVEKLRG